MDVGNVRGIGGVDKNAGRPERLDVRPDAEEPNAAPVDSKTDRASISDAGRNLQAKVQEYSNRLRQPDTEREAYVEQVRERMDAGELDKPDVYEATARGLLRGDA